MGYLILYITARPDMQQKKVVAWLAQHNFPHGLVTFMDGLSADPLRQKANYLRGLINDAKIQVCRVLWFAVLSPTRKVLRKKRKEL